MKKVQFSEDAALLFISKGKISIGGAGFLQMVWHQTGVYEPVFLVLRVWLLLVWELQVTK